MSEIAPPAGALGKAAFDSPRAGNVARSRRVRTFLFYATMPGLAGINAVVGLLLPWLLGPEQFGQYAIVVTLYQYGLVFDFGLSQLTDRRVPVLIAKGDTAALDRFVAPVLWLRCYIAGSTLAVGCMVMGWLAGHGRLPFGFWSGVLSLTAGLCFMIILGLGSVYRASSERRIFGLLNIVLAVILAVARPVGMVAGGILGCFVALALSFGIVALVMQARMPLVPAKRPGLASARSLLLQGMPLFLTSFIWAFYMTANRWVVSGMAPGVLLGEFAFGTNVVALIVGTVGGMSQYYYPRVVAGFAAAGAFGVSRRVTRDFLLLLASVALASAVGVEVGPLLIRTFYPKFGGAGAATQILLLAVPSLVLAAWLMPLALSTAKRPWIEGLLIYPLALLVLMAVTHTGYRLDGIVGAGYGLVISAVPLLALQLCTLRLTKLLRWTDAAAIFVAAEAATAALWLMLP